MERYPEETESDFRDEIEAGNTPKTDTEEGICPEKPRLDSLPFWGVFFAMEILVSAWVLLIMEWFQSFRGGFELFGNEVNGSLFFLLFFGKLWSPNHLHDFRF